MEIILARHGNTFAPGQPVVWVGSQNDLPLVESGKEQAKKLGKVLLQANISPVAVYTGPLQRMTNYADILLKEMNLAIKPIIDMRLNEVDYGKWSGLTSEEVCAQFGKDQFEKWEKESKWPNNSGWGESEELVVKRIRQFAQDCAQKFPNETILVVASNGCLRYFLDLIPGELAKRITDKTIKIATGNMCKLSYKNATWRIDYWNVNDFQSL